MMIISLSIFLLLTLTPKLAHSTQILSCTDSPSTVSGANWKSSVPLLKTQLTRSTSSNYNQSHESWYYEGVSATTGGEVTLTYEDDLTKRGTDVKLYLEYLNESPRRVVVENVKNELGGATGPGTNFVLLPGDSSDNGGWRNGIFPVMQTSASEKLKLTAILKKPQRLYIRKLVLVQSSPGPATRSLTDLLKTRSCMELAEMQKQTTTSRPAPAGSPTSPSSTQRTAPDCRNNKATQMGGGGDNSCSVCPECKCVCNCNCNKEGC